MFSGRLYCKGLSLMAPHLLLLQAVICLDSLYLFHPNGPLSLCCTLGSGSFVVHSRGISTGLVLNSSVGT